jgi:calpain, invertebrate
MLGCSSPAGSDTHTSSLGIVRGHAYSVLDAHEVEGNKLVQVRNPWGDEHEWKGAWGDKSEEWTERRKQIVYERMRQRGTTQVAIGADDGTFWMSFVDWFRNFASLSMCKYFNEDYTEINFNSAWSKKNSTVGGCVNHESFPNNPHLSLTVQGNGPVEVFILLTTAFKEGDNGATISIGFRIVENDGERLKGRYYKKEVARNYRGYVTSTRVSLDTKLNPTANFPYLLVPTTFEPGIESEFTLTLWYNHTQGTVTMSEMK